jgi:PKD repeat protein
VLTAGYATGCVNSITIAVQANPRTVPSFTSNVPCFGLPTNFTDQTTNVPNQWTWDFGDGSITVLREHILLHSLPKTDLAVLIQSPQT